MHNPPQAAGVHPLHRGRLPGRIAITVEPVLPVDILGAWVLLPVLPSAAAAAGAAPNRADPD